MGYRSFDFGCTSCQHTFEYLLDWNGLTSEPAEANPLCPQCQAPTERCLHLIGSAHAAQTDPAKQAEIMSKTKHMQLRLQGKLPWRKSSYSQSSNE